MVERQPGRPTVEEFTGAALRFIEDNYAIEPIHVNLGMYAQVRYMKVGRSDDIDVLIREIKADGIPGKRESIRDFAVKQLAWYQKFKKT